MKWTERKTPIGTIMAVNGVNGITFIAIVGGKPLAGKSYGLNPEAARKVAAALNAAADEVEQAGVPT